ncbi:MAG: protoporphyrinogen IX oxidase [Rhodobacterales bacterium]|nr:protoporphyrinogen IX oxidase [Rhodobacterales bacterium]
MYFLTFKALHIVAVVSWFSGLFYIVRLFVYITEAHDKPAAERDILLPQLKLMSSRLWFGITWPAGIATLVFGTAMLSTYWPMPQWLWIKLAMVSGLCIYHGICHWIQQRLQADNPPLSSRNLRIWNEVATLFLVSIVFLVVLKDSLAMLWAIGGFVVFAAVLMLGITAYRRLRTA